MFWEGLRQTGKLRLAAAALNHFLVFYLKGKPQCKRLMSQMEGFEPRSVHTSQSWTLAGSGRQGLTWLGPLRRVYNPMFTAEAK